MGFLASWRKIFYSNKWSYHRRARLCKHNRHIWGRIYIFGTEFGADPVAQNGFKSNPEEVIRLESWGRYWDDTFDIEVGELSKIENVDRFTKHINRNVLENKLRFEEQTSNSELEFLDIKVCLKVLAKSREISYSANMR